LIIDHPVDSVCLTVCQDDNSESLDEVLPGTPFSSDIIDPTSLKQWQHKAGVSWLEKAVPWWMKWAKISRVNSKIK